jgi:hypothetical protein
MLLALPAANSASAHIRHVATRHDRAAPAAAEFFVMVTYRRYCPTSRFPEANRRRAVRLREHSLIAAAPNPRGCQRCDQERHHPDQGNVKPQRPGYDQTESGGWPVDASTRAVIPVICGLAGGTHEGTGQVDVMPMTLSPTGCMIRPKPRPRAERLLRWEPRNGS